MDLPEVPHAERPPDSGQHAEGKLIAVRCDSCGAAYYATAVVRAQPGAPPQCYGVTWV